MTVKHIMFLGIVFALAGAFVWYEYFHDASLSESTSLSQTSPHLENTPYYEISVEFPTATALEEVASDVAINRMKDFLSGLITGFKENGGFENLTTEDIRIRGFDQGRKESLKVLFFESVTPNTDAYVFTIYEDTGGAHGNTTFKTFMFDKSTGAELSLADLFQTGTKYLDELSRLSRAKLPAVIGEYADSHMITSGTTPEEQNFSNFVFDGTDLLILFPPYQVASYAQGPITLRLTSADLSNILQTRYP